VKGHETLLGWRKLLQDTDCELCATAQHAGLYRGGKLVVPMRINADNLPILHGRALTTSELTSGLAVVSNSMLWHAGLGHPSQAVVTKLVRQELVPPSGGQPIHPTECDASARGKALRVIRQPPSGSHALAPGEEIHSEIFFPGSATATGATCALTMVDAYSRYAWAFPCSTKAHCGEALLNEMRNIDKLAENARGSGKLQRDSSLRFSPSALTMTECSQALTSRIISTRWA
jgi:hypothetical protein